MRMIKVIIVMIKVMIMRMIIVMIMRMKMTMIMRMMVTAAPWRAGRSIVIMKGSVETKAACPMKCSCCTITLQVDLYQS